MKDFSSIAAPMTEVIKKNVGFKWAEEQEKAFQLTKEKTNSCSFTCFRVVTYKYYDDSPINDNFHIQKMNNPYF